MDKYLEETRLLNFRHESIQQLIRKKEWQQLNQYNQIEAIYNFVRDDILFGYNRDDMLRASEILKDGYGQCNTKGILLMTLFRSVGIPCRIHGFTIDKKLQKGAITGWMYQVAPKNVLHSWVEVYFDENWYFLEGFIIDQRYLKQLQNKFTETKRDFCGYGIATKNFENPPIMWQKNHTFIQKEGINQDFGVFDSPDTFFSSYKQQLSPVKKFFYQTIGRKKMNRNVENIRKGKY